MPLQNH